jgi:hypothetical protein
MGSVDVFVNLVNYKYLAPKAFYLAFGIRHAIPCQYRTSLEL